MISGVFCTGLGILDCSLVKETHASSLSKDHTLRVLSLKNHGPHCISVTVSCESTKWTRQLFFSILWSGSQFPNVTTWQLNPINLNIFFKYKQCLDFLIFTHIIFWMITSFFSFFKKKGGNWFLFPHRSIESYFSTSVRWTCLNAHVVLSSRARKDK